MLSVTQSLIWMCRYVCTGATNTIPNNEKQRQFTLSLSLCLFFSLWFTHKIVNEKKNRRKKHTQWPYWIEANKSTWFANKYIFFVVFSSFYSFFFSFISKIYWLVLYLFTSIFIQYMVSGWIDCKKTVFIDLTLNGRIRHW